MTILRGLTLVYTDGKPITLGSGDLAIKFGQIGGGKIFGIPTPALIMIYGFITIFFSYVFIGNIVNIYNIIHLFYSFSKVVIKFVS